MNDWLFGWAITWALTLVNLMTIVAVSTIVALLVCFIFGLVSKFIEQRKSNDD